MSAIALLPQTRVLRIDHNTVVTEVVITQDAQVLAGHYPHFPILPGVFTVDAVHRAVERHAADNGAGVPRLTAVHSARFAAPVLPGDTLTVECTVSVHPSGRDVNAICSTSRGRTGTYRLKYADAEVPGVD